MNSKCCHAILIGKMNKYLSFDKIFYKCKRMDVSGTGLKMVGFGNHVKQHDVSYLVIFMRTLNIPLTPPQLTDMGIHERLYATA